MTRPVNATERLALRQAFIPKGAQPYLEHENGSALFVYEHTFPTGATKIYAIAFWGTSAKPLWHHGFKTIEQRDRMIGEFRDSVNHSVEYKAKHRADETAKVCTLKVGDIVNTSWGYDQTNVDFFVVTRVSAKMVWVRPIASDYEATGHMCGRAWPVVPVRMVGDETKHICRGNSFLIDGHHASLTTGDKYTSSYA